MLKNYKRNGLWRTQRVIEERCINYIYVDKQRCLQFCSNDYLGLAQEDSVKKAFANAVHQYGFGSASSPAVSGYCKSHAALEEAFCEFLGREQTIFFNSGYSANMGTLAALGKVYGTVLSDKLSHASIIDGIRLSQAKHRRFRHRDTEHLTHLLSSNGGNCLVVTESVFSTSGAVAPLKTIVSQTQTFGGMLVVDDAHGIGVFGRQGGGICELLQLTQQQVPCLIAPLGKAFGAVGAVVSGLKEVIEIVLQFARPYRYSTALPPAVAETLLTTLVVLKKENWRRERLQQNIAYFKNGASARRLPLMIENTSIDCLSTPIQSFFVGNNHMARQIYEKIFQKGFLVGCFRPPTVAKGTARLRCTLNCWHTTIEIDQLLDCMLETYQDFIPENLFAHVN